MLATGGAIDDVAVENMSEESRVHEAGGRPAGVFGPILLDLVG